MKNVVLGSGLCPLAVRFKINKGFCGGADDIVARVKALKHDIRANGRLFENYPQSLFDEILSWREIDPNHIEIEGARSSIAIALKVVKAFCGDSARAAIAYAMGAQSGGATRLVERSLQGAGVEPLFEYIPDQKGDNQIDVVIEAIASHATARVYQASRSAFKYRCDLQNIEKKLGANVNVLMLNRAAQGAKDAARTLLERGGGDLVSFRVHNFSRYAGVAENAEMLEHANFIFITDPAKDPSICRALKQYYDAATLDELARRVLGINDIPRMVVVPPSDECENLRFYTGAFNRCVEVKCPDSPRAKTAWLNGACVALTCKDWGGAAPFELSNRFPKTYNDFEAFCDWAVQLAYADSVGGDFKISDSWLVK